MIYMITFLNKKLFKIRHGASVWDVNGKNRCAIDVCVSDGTVSTAVLETIPEERLKEYINFRRGQPPLLWKAARKVQNEYLLSLDL